MNITGRLELKARIKVSAVPRFCGILLHSLIVKWREDGGGGRRHGLPPPLTTRWYTTRFGPCPTFICLSIAEHIATATVMARLAFLLILSSQINGCDACQL